VIGFPLGATVAAVKVFEADEAIKLGAQEVDMVLNIGRLKSQHYGDVYRDIAGVVAAAHAKGAQVKVIIETALLAEEEKVAACGLAQEAGADFVKTSTGFSGGGATLADVQLMRQVVGAQIGVKASGGIRTAMDALKMVAAGATRIGASAGVSIVQALAAGSAASDPGRKTKDSY
jgi:deoxyribose-phosphate aldolase